MYTYTYRFPFVESSSAKDSRAISIFSVEHFILRRSTRVYLICLMKVPIGGNWERRIIEISNKIVRCNEEFQGLLFNLTIIYGDGGDVGNCVGIN